MLYQHLNEQETGNSHCQEGRNVKATGKLTLGLALLLCFMGLASQAGATSLDTSNDLGTIQPDVPSGAADELSYLNALLDLALSTSTTFSDQSIVRSDVACSGGVCEDAVSTGAVKDDTDPPTTFNVTGFTYLMAKYGGAGASGGGAIVWDVTGLTEVTIPASAFTGVGLSHWVLYNPTGGGGSTQTPEPGIALLLGAGLVTAAAVARRRFKK